MLQWLLWREPDGLGFNGSMHVGPVEYSAVRRSTISTDISPYELVICISHRQQNDGEEALVIVIH